MIESKILGSAPGIQRQDVIDKSETTVLPSLTNGVIKGRFKRGRMDKPFKVAANNYKALLGHDPSNPSYLAVEDCFKRGVSEISVLRVGSTGSVMESPETNDGGGFNPIVCTPVSVNFMGDYYPILNADSTVKARYRVNDGQWIDYESNIYSDSINDAIERFVSSIKDKNGQKLVATAVIDRELVSTAFYCPGGSNGIFSGANPISSETHFAQMDYDKDASNKIEFKLVTIKPYDLVATMFNGDATVISCGLVFWAFA